MITEYMFIPKLFFSKVTQLRSIFYATVPFMFVLKLYEIVQNYCNLKILILNNLEINDVMNGKAQDIIICDLLRQRSAQSYMTSMLSAYRTSC